ncbi:TonB-dependent receptor [Sphingobium phenoxybenzoativorans]|uniref:TonB-dependent receptor n=1 Tax=Sphingobium phenoxybenzoativorans TaxID=1592790 RepID=A0A975K6N6_9SPHN|nr:TonB-dependent receptor [Sphingobium phenoxybenzoativorans]QUT05781.1 TonB-dependent receptor [Sphingobium phenoxybenzoativorans]
MSNLKLCLRAGIGATAFAMGLWASVAGAQVAGSAQDASGQIPAAEGDQGSGAIADIIVTAERREASVQKTPIAMTALGGDMLQKNQTVDIEGFADSIPNVTFGKNTGSAKIFIRGVGLDAITPGSDPRVAIYTDGIYQPRSQAAFVGLFDLERVEVLAGPQGTLYGRNATAGAINLISRNPGDEFNAYATLSASNYGLMRAEGAVGGPITDTVGARIAVQKSVRQGYGEMIDTGLDVDDENSFGVRGKLTFKPSETFDATIVADYYKADDHTNGLHVLALTPGHVPTPTLFGYENASNPRDLAGTRPESHIRAYGVSLTANLELGSLGKLTSVSGWRRFKQDGVYDADQTTFAGTPAPIRENSESWSQELRITGSVGIVDYLVGAYYFKEDAFAGIDPTIRLGMFGVPLDAGGLFYIRGPLYGGDQTTKAWAVFTQETINLTDKLGIDLGLRFSHERRKISEFTEFDGDNFTTPIENPLYTPNPLYTSFLDQSASYKSTDPKVTVHYQFTPQTMAYVTFSKGFKSGGFNAGFLQAPFSPEKLTMYEGGIKADLFDRRLRANVAAFYYDYSNLQVNITEGIRLITRNAAKAKLYGFEGQFTAVPVDDLRLNLNLSYLHSEYTNYLTPNPLFPGQSDPGVTIPDSANPGGPGLPAFDLSGNQLAYAPKYKIDGEIAYTIHAGFADITPRANVTWTSRTYFSQFNEPWAEQPSYTKVDAFLDIENKDLGLSGTIFVRNLTNKYYETSGTVSSDFLGYQVVGALGAPRTYGVTLTKRF